METRVTTLVCVFLTVLLTSLDPGTILVDAVFDTRILMKNLATLRRPSRPARSSIANCPVAFDPTADPGLENVPASLRDIVDGRLVPGDSGVSPTEPPPWLDRAKFKRGQAFARKYVYAVAYADVLGLFLNFLFPGELEPLIFTGRSDTPYEAFKRYLSTVSRVTTWYEGDPWKPGDPAYKNIARVRGYHLEARSRMQQASATELYANTSIGADSTPRGIWSNTVERMCLEFTSGTCPNTVDLGDDDITRRVHLNQLDMSLTQFAFVGLVIAYPSKFGIHGNVDEDLDAFVHLWEALGYALGIEDKYNFCRGGLGPTRIRTLDHIEYLAKPRLRTIDRRWEHMLRVLFEGLSYYNSQASYEVSLVYLLDVIGVPAPRLHAALSLNNRLMYKYLIFFMSMATRVPGVVNWASDSVRIAIKKANNSSEQWHESLKRKTYRYQYKPSPAPYRCGST